ncbi:MAG TPA: T9SS type A sorting domain-containing protein, partial [Bacteroidales bacterium]|nr:T9SS type A sorting domain-containing protein [Bacteroidales bacterium]
TPTIIPNAALTGNASGFTTSLINISMLDPATYPRIYIHATFAPETASPEIFDWTVKARGGTLPVELKTFEATLIDQTAVLAWTTFSETNNDYFMVEKSNDGKEWKDLARVSGAGNSNIPINYKEKDRNPYSPITYYRLSQIDFNGTTEILGIHSVSMKEAIGEEMVNIYPNPAVNSANCEIISNSEKNILLKVINLFGQITYSEEISVYKGTNKIPINIEVLQGGSYLILVEDEYGIPIGRKKLIVK